MIDFVLDEDIYHRAMEADCTEAPFDLRASRVVDLLQTAHRWVISSDVEVAYRKRFDQVECHGAFAVIFMTRLNENLATQERSCLIHDAALIEGRHSADDQHVVNAACARDEGCFLITSDEQLRSDLVADGTPEKYRFNVIGLQDAERLLGIR